MVDRGEIAYNMHILHWVVSLSLGSHVSVGNILEKTFMKYDDMHLVRLNGYGLRYTHSEAKSGRYLLVGNFELSTILQ
jgi:hypothetical protein